VEAKGLLVGYTTDREFMALQAPWHPAPKVLYLVVRIISQSGFDDAIHRADSDALGRIVVTDTFDAGCLVDDVGDAVAFTDGFGGTFGDACTTGDAFFKDFHGHGGFSVKMVFLRP
jgi:hypothetical protein